MAQYSQHYTTEWNPSNTSDSSRSNYQVHSSSAPRLFGAPTLPYPPPQDSSNTYPQPHQESASSNMDGQSAGHQGQASTTLVFPPSQSTPVTQNAYHPSMNMPSYATMGEASFPTTPMSGYSPYGSSATSASSSVSGFGSSVQEYQASSTPGYSNEYAYPPSTAAPAGHVGVSSLGTAQTSQVNEFSGITGQPNTNVFNNNGATYYNPGYYAGYY